MKKFEYHWIFKDKPTTPIYRNGRLINPYSDEEFPVMVWLKSYDEFLHMFPREMMLDHIFIKRFRTGRKYRSAGYKLRIYLYILGRKLRPDSYYETYEQWEERQW